MSIDLLRQELADKHPLPNDIPTELTEERLELLGAMVFQDFMFNNPAGYLHLLADLNVTLGKIDTMVSRNGYFNLMWHQENMATRLQSMELSDASLAVVFDLLGRIDEDTPDEPPHPELDEVLKKVWYRGVRVHPDFDVENLYTDGSTGREGYGVFLTDSINQAYSYAGREGYILTMEIAPDVLLRDYDDGGSKHHSLLRYDQQVREVGSSRAVMVKGVVDNGAFGDEVVREQAVNLGFSANTTKLKVVEVTQAVALQDKLTFKESNFLNKLNQAIAEDNQEEVVTPKKPQRVVQPKV